MVGVYVPNQRERVQALEIVCFMLDLDPESVPAEIVQAITTAVTTTARESVAACSQGVDDNG